VVTGHNFEIILPKDHPCHVCFKLTDWFQRRRLLNNFPIGRTLWGKNVLKSSLLKPVSQYSKHVIDGPLVVNCQNCGSYVKTMSADGGHLGWKSGSLDKILKVDHLRTILAMFALNWLTGFRGKKI
jgi:hypothetical protein